MTKKEIKEVSPVMPEIKQDNKHVNIHVNSIDGLKELIEKNIKWSQVIYEQNRKIKNRLNLIVVGDYVKLFIILIPVILAIVYLPPFLKELFDQYSGLLGIGGGASNQVNDILSQFSSDQIGDLLKMIGNQ